MRIFARIVIALVLTGARGMAQAPNSTELDRAYTAFYANDYGTAFPILQRGADRGGAKEAHFVAYMYENGLGVPRDSAKALTYFVRSADGGYVYGMRSAATYFANGYTVGVDWSKAARYWRSCADLGDDECASSLGRLYLFGNGVPVDTATAYKYFQSAGLRGNAYAQAILGWAYANGLGVRRDSAQAREWYLRSAESGSWIGAHNLGQLTWTADPWQTKALFELSARLGDTSAGTWLKALQPALSHGGDAEYREAQPLFRVDNARYFALMREAMRKGHVLAAAAVVEAYQYGYGVGEDAALARRAARVCATIGNDNCQTILAQYLLAGTGGNRDPEGARLNFEAAALQNNTLAMFKLAEMYDSGDGIDRNNAVAMYWYRAADERGSPKAHALLKARGLLEVDPKVKAFLEMIDRDGPDQSSLEAMTYEVAVYCIYGGKKCHELQVATYRFQQSNNKRAAAANMARLWNVYAAPKGSSDTDYAKRSECMRKRMESLTRETYGKQNWHFEGSC